MYLFAAQKLSLEVALIYVKEIVKTSLFHCRKKILVAVLNSSRISLLFCFGPHLMVPGPCFSLSGKLELSILSSDAGETGGCEGL